MAKDGEAAPPDAEISHSHEGHDLMGIGQHCCVAKCRQLDFLPVTCADCGQVTCSAHFPAAEHDCPMAAKRAASRTLPTCPLCSRLVRLDPAQPLDAQMDAHIRSGCTKLLARTGRQRPRCASKRCKAKPFMTCPQCHASFCPSHRFPDQHDCTARLQSPARQAGAAAAARHAVACH